VISQIIPPKFTKNSCSIPGGIIGKKISFVKGERQSRSAQGKRIWKAKTM
jgi:hypothetical protein